MNPALTSHVLNNNKICFLKVRRADADLTPMSPMRRRYSVRSLRKSNTLSCKLRKIDCFILFPIEPEHEINLRGAPYELVPGYFVNSLLVLTTYVIREGPGEHVHLCNLARVSLLTIIKFEVDEDSDQKKNLYIYVRCVLNILEYQFHTSSVVFLA